MVPIYCYVAIYLARLQPIATYREYKVCKSQIRILPGSQAGFGDKKEEIPAIRG